MPDHAAILLAERIEELETLCARAEQVFQNPLSSAEERRLVLADLKQAGQGGDFSTAKT